MPKLGFPSQGRTDGVNPCGTLRMPGCAPHARQKIHRGPKLLVLKRSILRKATTCQNPPYETGAPRHPRRKLMNTTFLQRRGFKAPNYSSSLGGGGYLGSQGGQQ